MPRAGFLILLFVLACRSSRASRAPAAGELEVGWRDSSRVVALRAPAEARWCPRDSMLELLAINHDTSFGVVLLARDSLRADGFPVFQGGVFAPWRPQATAALHVLTAENVLKAFLSTWGQVTLAAAGATQVSGSFDLHVKLSPGTDSLHLVGSFTRIPVRPAADPCGRANRPRTP